MTARQEVTSFQKALSTRHSQGDESNRKSRKVDVPLAYMVCQKRVATKFMTTVRPQEDLLLYVLRVHSDLTWRFQKNGQKSMPAGTLVKGLEKDIYPSFYINGTSPNFSTAKPVRFIVATKDEALQDTPLEELSWTMCHDYSNWAGPIK
jgi:hypothetical protein